MSLKTESYLFFLNTDAKKRVQLTIHPVVWRDAFQKSGS